MPPKITKTKIPFRQIEPYLYLAPATILIILVFVFPIIENIHTSFLQNTASGIKTLGLNKLPIGIPGSDLLAVAQQTMGKLLFQRPDY